MTKSPPITISSAELREQVEDLQDRLIPDKIWDEAEAYARRKLEIYRERWPEVEHYDNAYLVILTSDTVREQELAAATRGAA